MKIEQAKQLVLTCAAQMNERYQKTVFDEWALIAVAENKGHLLAYNGPRKRDFQTNFLADAGSLRAGLLAREHEVGDYEFARHEIGTGFESYMSVGPGVFLICNNTVQSMDAIARDPRWLGAQVPFVELSERFREDPVALAG